MEQQQQQKSNRETKRSCYMCQDEITPDTFGAVVAADNCIDGVDKKNYLCDLCLAEFMTERVLAMLVAEKEKRRKMYEGNKNI